MYDALTTRYTFSCPRHGRASVTLSSFRRLERLPGAAHPAVFDIRFDCACGDEHPGLVSDSELDWAPLGLEAGAFLNLMTSRLDDAASELADRAARQIQAGQWPWSFFCFPEERPRPVFPSSFWVLVPGDATGTLALVVRCPACARLSVNLVSRQHVDLPFHHDPTVGVVAHLFGADFEPTLEGFRQELHSTVFDTRRLGLE